MRQLYAGEMLEVLDWRTPFVRLADGAGFVEDPAFDGHRTVTAGRPRWAPSQVAGTTFSLRAPKPLVSSAKSANTKAEKEPLSSARENPLTMSEKDLKTEVKF